MSPLGRTFIVLNLLLAGAYFGFAGTFLQRQHSWKQLHEESEKARQKEVGELQTKINDLTSTNRELTIGKTAMENQKNASDSEVKRLNDDKKRLEEVNASLAADIKKMTSVAEANRTTVAQAFEQSQGAFKLAQDAAAARDEAIRTKDATEATNRELNNQITALNSTVTDRDLSIAGLSKEKSELTLLVDVAKVKGFLESMAVPMLAGTVSIVSGNLCTLQITDNPTNADIKPGYPFAVYDETGFKAEARVTSVDSERNAVFCTFSLKKGEVKAGDKASTKLGGY